MKQIWMGILTEMKYCIFELIIDPRVSSAGGDVKPFSPQSLMNTKLQLPMQQFEQI